MAGGPQLTADAYVEGPYDIEGPTLHLTIRNKGRGPMTVDHVMFWIKVDGYERVGIPVHSKPVRIEGKSSSHWSVSASHFATAWVTTRGVKEAVATATLGDGRVMEVAVDTTRIDETRELWLPDADEEDGTK